MQNARSTAAISRASEGYHFSHDALVTCKLPIEGRHAIIIGILAGSLSPREPARRLSESSLF